MRNKLIDLNNHLFEQLERLNDEDIVGKDLENEIRRAKASASLGIAIVKTGELALKAQQYQDEYGDRGEHLPEMLKIGHKKDA